VHGDIPELEELGRAGGVRLLATGSGPTVVVFPGMEGSGESCLQLASDVVLTGQGEGRLVLVDYSQERHRFLGALVDTVAGLLERHLNRSPMTLWGQSFGNLLLAGVAPLVATTVRTTVLVSPFTGLPTARLRAARMVLAATPQFVYAATTPAISRMIFGPAPKGTGVSFFSVLCQMRVADLRRRTGWLLAGDLAGMFQSLPGPVGIWFGDNDRLVDLPRQLAFFTTLTRAVGGRVTVLDGCGHVLLPEPVVQVATQDIRDWLTSPAPAPGPAAPAPMH
jgi:pimeloyl-ACP methyl ester carboxylesterase